MKQIAMRVMQRIIAFSLCIVLLLTNIGMIMPNKDNNTQISIQTEENHNVEVSQVKEDKKITTRGDIERKQEIKEYKVYELIINEEILYFDNFENANKKKNYLLNNTINLPVVLNENIQNNLDNISSEDLVNSTINKYINKYKKPTTCFPTISHKVSSTFGKRSRGDYLTGIDLCGKYGDDIYAYKSGKVIKVQYSNVSYGNMVLIEHNDGTKTRYAHMSSIIVSNGQYVDCGQKIGYMGSTGNSTGNHLHFEIIVNNKAVNPYNYIF